MGEIGLFPADPVEPHVPGKGLYRLDVALLQSACWGSSARLS